MATTKFERGNAGILKRTIRALGVVRQHSGYIGVLPRHHWVWKQRVAVTSFLVAFQVRRIWRFTHLRCGLAAHLPPQQRRHRDYWMAKS